MPRLKTAEVNQHLVAINHAIRHTGRYLCAQGRNGYIGIDIYRGDPANGNAGDCLDNLVCGTFKECIRAADLYADKPH